MNAISFVAIAGILLWLDARLAVLVFLPVPFLVGGGGWFWRKLVPMFHKHGTRMARLHTILGESIRGIKIDQGGYARRRGGRASSASPTNLSGGIQVAIDKTFRGFFEVMFWIMSLGVAAVWYFAAKRLSAQRDRPDAGRPAGLRRVHLALLRAAAVVHRRVELDDARLRRRGAHLLRARFAAGGVRRARAPSSCRASSGAIAFHDVRFSYERGKEVIKGISFEIAAGEMVGLVGKSGAGKSTIINLVCRFYDVDSGLITMDGHPIKKVKLEQLRRQIGIVMQEPFLFNATILENIRYGRPEATLRGGGPRRPGGPRARVHPRRRRTATTPTSARAARRSPAARSSASPSPGRSCTTRPSSILDEATSSVDSETEKAIQEAIANLIARPHHHRHRAPPRDACATPTA